MKKVLFVLILIVLTGGVWYVNKNASSDNFDKGNFDKAVQLMQNLQSSAIPSSLTSDQLATLETAYNDATARQPSIEAFRTADRASLEQIFTANNITGTLKDDIVNLANSLVDDYNAGIDTKLAALPTTVTSATRTAIKRLTDSINSLSNDIRLTIQFISWYAAKRPNICEKTADPTNNQYIKGTITFRYDEARTPVIETCDGNTLSEYYCSGLEYIAGDPLYNKIRTCEFGCNDGACLKGSLGAVSTVDAATANGIVMGDIRANQTFYLKLAPTRVHTARATSNTSGTEATIVSGGIGYTTAPTVTVTGGTCTVRPTARATIVDGSISEIKLIGANNCTAAPTLAIAAPTITAANTTLTAVVDSPSFAAKCTLTTKTLPIVTSGADLYFGPITCNTVENHTFTVNLMDGTQTIGTVDKIVAVGSVSMGRFEITAPDKVAAGNDFSITVKTIGNNGLPITSYADDFFIIIDGDDDATFPAGAQRMAGTSEKVISGLRFSKGGSIKITIRGVGVADTVDRTITVTGAQLSVKKNNATSYSRGEVTFNVGDTYAYKWEGTNGTSASSSYTSVKASGGNCGAGGTWLANTLAGTYPVATVAEVYRGCTFTILYKVTNSAITNTPAGNNTATDTLIFKVNE